MSHWYDSTPKKSLRKRDSNPGSSALEAVREREGGGGGREGGREGERERQREREREADSYNPLKICTVYHHGSFACFFFSGGGGGGWGGEEGGRGGGLGSMMPQQHASCKSVSGMDLPRRL